MEDYIKQIKDNVPKLKNKNIKIIDLAVGCHKQPQQFYISTYFADMFDLSINIQGFNEISNVGMQKEMFPLDYPCHSIFFYAGVENLQDRLNQSRNIARITRGLKKITLSNPWLVKSDFYYLIWKSIQYYAIKKNTMIDKKFNQETRKKLKYKFFDDSDPFKLIDERIAINMIVFDITL